jgi:hypothetical protein
VTFFVIIAALVIRGVGAFVNCGIQILCWCVVLSYCKELKITRQNEKTADVEQGQPEKEFPTEDVIPPAIS